MELVLQVLPLLVCLGAFLLFARLVKPRDPGRLDYCDKCGREFPIEKMVPVVARFNDSAEEKVKQAGGGTAMVAYYCKKDSKEIK